jgi:hypothetical protein
VLLIYPRLKVHQGDVAAVDAFRKRGKELLDRHVLFDVLPDDRLSPSRRAGYRAVLEGHKPADLPVGLSTFKAPATVRISANTSASGNEITLHFVNYNREEPKVKRSAGAGIKDEKPIAVEGVAVDFVLPAGVKVTGVQALTPESQEAVEVKYTVEKGRIRFRVGKFLVYSVVRMRLSKG